MRLDRLLSHLQYGSRKDVKKIIKAARVQVNGQLVRDPSVDVAESATVAVDGQVLSQSVAAYYLLNKPKGVVTSTKDPEHRTVLDLVAAGDQRPGLFPVGRLDKDTTGLLLITNDGTLGHALLSPTRHVPKTYEAKLALPLTEGMRQRLQTGIVFKDFISQPAAVTVVPGTDSRLVHITIHEGKFHQVKRMFLAVSNEVQQLTRIQMGPLALPADLARGQYRALTAEELAALRATIAD